MARTRNVLHDAAALPAFQQLHITNQDVHVYNIGLSVRHQWLIGHNLQLPIVITTACAVNIEICSTSDNNG